MAQCTRGGTFMAATPTTTTPTTMMAGTTDGGAATLEMTGPCCSAACYSPICSSSRSFVRLVCRCMWMSFADLAALRWWFPASFALSAVLPTALVRGFTSLLHRSSGLPTRARRRLTPSCSRAPWGRRWLALTRLSQHSSSLRPVLSAQDRRKGGDDWEDEAGFDPDAPVRSHNGWM